MNNVFAEGYIIITNQYVEGIFANDYMAIYFEKDNIITVSLQALTFKVLKFPTIKMNYISYKFSCPGKLLYPGEEYIFFSNVNFDDLHLSISENIVQDKESILEQLFKLREIFQI